MDLFLFILLIIIIISGNVFIYGIIIYNKYQQYIIRINEVESFIDNAIREKYDLLNKSISVIKGNCDIKEELFPEIVKLRSRKMSSFELDRKLIQPLNQFYEISNEYHELRKSDAFVEILSSLNEIEDNLTSYKEYYDQNITRYNEIIRKFPTNIIGKIYKYEEKSFFDGKDIDDSEDIKL